MKAPESTLISNRSLAHILADLFALVFIYFMPALAHLTGIPLYMIEPMRLILILSMAHSGKINTILLALTLPFFSFMVSGHPEFIKMLIITGELLLNTILFYWLVKRIRHPFFSMALSIILSKIACYLAYWPVFSFAFVIAEAEPTFLLIQAATTLLFSSYIYIIMTKKIQ